MIITNKRFVTIALVIAISSLLSMLSIIVPSQSFAMPSKATGKKILESSVKLKNVGGEKTLTKDEKLTLTVTVTQATATNKKLKWSSSKPSVVSVPKKRVIEVKKTFAITAVALKKSSANYIVHRGLSSLAPENTLPAFELACANGLELFCVTIKDRFAWSEEVAALYMSFIENDYVNRTVIEIDGGYSYH